ncbi:hypothetical protein N7495_007477 [Penicillium taxi]|uniref:uncharacterized protein n=1 Tax=Penicillium taxi TaxID=168475 RepID=UPI002545B68B|nr:uncharacterized protein N7495_007477 [Penicillium taxi]KAJ5887436.1 hypothetical protein N7495_007477 [Penicillium taxi]
MAAVSISAPGMNSGLLFNNGNNNARVVVTGDAESPEFVQDCSEEGFDAIYVPLAGGGIQYFDKLKAVKEGLGVGENYAIIAFGEAASICLEHYMQSMNASRLCALVAYYPTRIPDTRKEFPLSLRVVVHLVGTQVQVVTYPTTLGLQGRQRRRTRHLDPGIGTSERLNWAYPAYTYWAESGFAEENVDAYNHLSASLAWTRTLQALRKGFSRDADGDLEKLVDKHQEAKYFKKNVSRTLDTYDQVTPAVVTYASTLSGGIGTAALRHFYDHYFLGELPPSMKIRLISRTTGADRVVDELHVSFDHTQEMPWMLPGVPPTNKAVEIIIVSIIRIRGGKLSSEHVYWDQASVLVQIGLLSPKLIPGTVTGVHRLPVVGCEAAQRIVNEDPMLEEENYHNKMIRAAKRKAKAKTKTPEQHKAHSDQMAEDSGVEVKSVAEQGNRMPEKQPATSEKVGEANGENNGNGKAHETKPSSETKRELTDRSAYIEDGSQDEQ